MFEIDGSAVEPRGKSAIVVPLPPVVDTQAVLLLGMVVGAARPVVLDAAAVREVEPTAAVLLESLLRTAANVRVANAPDALRRGLQGRPLAAFFTPALPADDELMFVCPDRDELGFQPSLR